MPIMIGLFGKIPRNGDFVRRQLPDTFVAPWDHWLRSSMATAQDELGPAFADLFPRASAWFYRLSPGACGPMAAGGILLPSRDAVGRLFPLTVAKLFADGTPAPDRSWYPAIEEACRSALEQNLTADLLLEALVAADRADAGGPGEAPAEGWWTSAGRELRMPGLPPADRFAILLREDV